MSLLSKVYLTEEFNQVKFEKNLLAVCKKEKIIVEKKYNGYYLKLTIGAYTFFMNLEREGEVYRMVNYTYKINENDWLKFIHSLQGSYKRGVYYTKQGAKIEKMLLFINKRDSSVDAKIDKTIHLNALRDNAIIQINKDSKLYGKFSMKYNYLRPDIHLGFEAYGQPKERVIKTSTDLKDMFPKKSAKDLKKIEIINEIKSCMNSQLRRAIGMGGDWQEAEIRGNIITIDVRYLGDWIHDEENNYDNDDDSWREDDDHMILSPKSYKQIKENFKKWIFSMSWKKLVKNFNIQTSEKNWMELIIEIK